jgi:uncharacterized damage-inducible protein DinB
MASSRISGFRGEFLWELEIVERQLIGLAEAIPEDKYDWRPAATARSVREVLIHVATGNFVLLDCVGAPPPLHLYGEVTERGPDRVWALVQRNDVLERELRDKSAVTSALRESLEAVQHLLSSSTDAAIDRPLHFFREETTVRRVYLRLLSHMHEHMGQMIGYARCMGLPLPWEDWRPDRRISSQ